MTLTFYCYTKEWLDQLLNGRDLLRLHHLWLSTSGRRFINVELHNTMIPVYCCTRACAYICTSTCIVASMLNPNVTFLTSCVIDELLTRYTQMAIRGGGEPRDVPWVKVAASQQRKLQPWLLLVAAPEKTGFLSRCLHLDLKEWLHQMIPVFHQSISKPGCGTIAWKSSW